MQGRATARVGRVLELSERRPDRDALGGVEIHVADLEASLGPQVEPFGAYLRSNELVVEAWRPERRELALLAKDLADAVSAALMALAIDLLHVHSPKLGPAALASAIDRSGARGVLTLHDTTFEELDLTPMIEAVDTIIVPSTFIADRFVRSYPARADKIRRMCWGVLQQQQVRERVHGNLRVAVVGVLAPEKGSERLPDLLRACTGLGIEWHLFGATEGRSLRAIRRAAPDLRAHGAYRRSELGRLLDAAAIDIALLPSIASESFSMTLSECVAAAVPVVASGIGALGERVRDEQCGWTFDPWRPESLAAVLESLRDRREIRAIKPRLQAAKLHTVSEMAAEHAAIYVELASGARRASEAERAWAAKLFEQSRSRGESTLRRAWRAVRRSKAYRDLALRRVLPEPLRAALERRAAQLLDRWNR